MRTQATAIKYRGRPKEVQVPRDVVMEQVDANIAARKVSAFWSLPPSYPTTERTAWNDTYTDVTTPHEVAIEYPSSADLLRRLCRGFVLRAMGQGLAFSDMLALLDEADDGCAYYFSELGTLAHGRVGLVPVATRDEVESMLTIVWESEGGQA